MPLQSTGISDLITTTLNNVEPLKFTDISAPLQRYLVMSKLMKKNKTVFDSGVDFRFDLMTDDNGSARFTGLYAQDIVNVRDVMTQGIVPWRHVNWNWAIERREIAMNRSPRKIVDLALTRRIASFISAIKLFESRFWRVRAATDVVNPWGVPYWIVKNATEGFNGTLPSGYTAVGGIVPSAFLNPDGTNKWANWTFQYSAVTRDALIRKWRKAAEFCDFDTAAPDMPTFNTGDDCGYYTNWGVLGLLVEILQTNNDDLGPDIAAYEGKTAFMQKPVERVPQLEEDTTNPVYGINWGEFKIAGLRDASITISGVWSSTHEEKFAGALGHSTTLSWVYGPESTTNGRRKLSGSAILTNFTVGSPVDDKVTMSMSLAGSGAITATTF